tara:strand:+ start:7050 stop:7211 length:162 start_codon:yes stop_codon:yes gene_type:complete
MKKKALIFGVTDQDSVKKKKLDLLLVNCDSWKSKMNFFKILYFKTENYKNFQK